MFRKRPKKHFPPGTFIPAPARICAIIQLCMAFSILLWNASEPFVGEIFTLKSRLLFYQEVMGIQTTDQIAPEKAERLARNTERFQALPNKLKDRLLDNFQQIQNQLQRSFWDKLTSVASLFAHKISPYELAWIFFSIVISIMLLKKVEGASQAVWILPVLVACYAVDTRLFPMPNENSLEEGLFPTESELVEKYVEGPLSGNVFEQQKQLLNAWKRYLVIDWTGQVPSEDKAVFDRQVEDGEFSFTLERLKLRDKQSDFLTLTKSSPPPSVPLLLVYFFWNTYFAYTAWKFTTEYNNKISEISGISGIKAK